MIRRIFKWTAIICLLVVLFCVTAVCSVWAYYRHVTGATPGALPLPVPAAALGAKVNVFSGTGGIPWMCAHNTPAATTPFGMVRLGPDTASLFSGGAGTNRSGYYYGSNRMVGFSHTRLVGADAQEGGAFRVFPSRDSRAAEDRKPERNAGFSHHEESGAPGYYAVRLPQAQVLVELTATPRVGVHRYTFDGAEGDAPHLLIEVSSAIGNKRTENATARIIPEAQEVEGSVRLFGSFSGRYDGLDVYFVARFNRAFASHGTWSNGAFAPSSTTASGDDAGVDLAFAPEAQGATAVEMRLGLSYVSVANARQNLDAEAGAIVTFDSIATSARDAWEQRLNVIAIEGGSETEQRIFYTALYRAFHMPTVFNDVNGAYRGFDKSDHVSKGFQYYTDFSLWDTCRTAQPLYCLIARKEARDMMVSLVEMAKAGGCLPRWPAGAGYTGSMMGTPADIAVSEAYQKGIRDFDVERAYAAMRQTALTGKPEGTRFSGREGLEEYVKLGYCPNDRMKESVACTLEYAYEDHAISLLAEALGHAEDATIFREHGQNYKNVWNAERQFFDGRNSDGSFQAEFNPLKLTYADSGGRFTRGYVEGSAWQWRWFAPHDPQGLIALFGGNAAFVQELETFFENTNDGIGQWHPGAYYWQGNEPDIHAAYLFNAVGRPDLTQKWVRQLLATKHSDDYVGLDGNDDGGTLSAWYVFSALGFYPIAGTTRYELGSPLFTKARIDLGGAVLSVVAENNSAANVYVRRVTLNGQPLDRTWFTHDEIAQGGELHFLMGPTPE
ncbi:MAG: glycoside hydrolase family 92 protein [Candidatus Hydrogenedentes bacterium]|nr:glycoside hydrolase family 92 protein [Candidatus Hydrogenedentota bacterium]